MGNFTTSELYAFEVMSNKLAEKFVGMVTDEDRVIFTVAGRDFFDAAEASLLILKSMTREDISKLLSTSARYAEILKEEVTSRLRQARGALDPYCEFAPGVYIVDDGQFVTGVILHNRGNKKSKKARLLNRLPVGAATIHRVSDHAILGGQTLVKELLPNHGPLILVDVVTWKHNYHAEMTVDAICFSKGIKTMDKYIVIPCNGSPLVSRLTHTSLRDRPCKDSLPTEGCPSIYEIEKIVAKHGSAVVVLSFRPEDKTADWIDLFMHKFSSLCAKWPIKVLVFDRYLQKVDLLGLYGIESEHPGTASDLVRRIERYRRGAIAGHSTTLEGVKSYYATIDTTTGTIAEDLGTDLSKIVFLTNHANKKQPNIVIAGDSVIMTARNPGAGYIFTWAHPDKKIKAYTQFLTLPADPKLAFASR